jgi:hypothetical protein
MAHSAEAPGGNGRGAVTTAKPFHLPGEKRTIL